MAKPDRGFKLKAEKDYIRLETWGALHIEDLDEPGLAALELAKKTGIKRLLDDIREVSPAPVPVAVQAKGMAILWKLHTFDKVAIVFKGKEMGWLFLSTIQAMHLNLSSKFKGFDDEVEAVAWLGQD